ncbi:MAG TPA: type II toxin-antitoxin system RelE/ParE family toxin [Gemmatimonadales bacterium]|nr:type II toxin-antitoxin system RelE/ParE family toxin [Gemmatimonadales bacterium]
MTRDPLKPVYWVASSLKDLRACPDEVQDVVGYALYLAQEGKQQHPAAKPLKGPLHGLVEVIADHARGTYRAVYTAKLASAVYVLHVFQKKATRGITTPKHVLDLIQARLRWAERHARGEVKEL